jgi:hypothetical protein
MFHASVLCGVLDRTIRCDGLLAGGRPLRASDRKQPHCCFSPANTQLAVSRVRPRRRADNMTRDRPHSSA